MKKYGFIFLVCSFLAGCSKTSGDIYVCQQTKEWEAGNRWPEYNLWAPYYEGMHGFDKNPVKADKWVARFLKDVGVERYEPAAGLY